MTGEITLRGKVLPVGGIKEKILAAFRVGIKEIIISEKNRKDGTQRAHLCVLAMREGYAAALTLVGTEAIVFRICEAI